MAPLSLLTYFLLPWLLLMCSGQDVDESIQSITESFENLQDTLNHKDSVVAALSRYVLLNRFQEEERIRAEGCSGIMQVRNYFQGQANYYTSTHVGHGYASIHDHSSYPDTLGMGEVIAVLNGVQFRTRHNDYLIKRPSSTSTNWHETETIPLPPVPQSVLDQPTVEDEIEEMKEYFRAFKEQNSTIRDYQDYFTSILCYLEGAWLSDTVNIEEAFESERNWYSGYTWEDLAEQARLEAYLGAGTRWQNGAQMPVTITGVDEETNEPVYAQWNYRIMCFPTGENIPTSYFKLVDEIAYRFPRDFAAEELIDKRGAHFVLDDSELKGYHDGPTILDRLVAKIPGKDNVPGELKEAALGLYDTLDLATGTTLNLGYYNRLYKATKGDAMNYDTRYRGFGDPNLFVALTTQPQVAPLLVTQCQKNNDCQRRTDIRASWMIPLEVVYLTPLLTWNPWKVVNREGADAGLVTKGVLNGNSPKTAYNGTNDKTFYRTPFELFESGLDEDRDQSDTVYYSRWVFDPKEVPHKMVASGTRIILPPIQDVGSVRLRYPIAPIHGEGNAIWKELNAFKDYLASQVMKLSETVN